MSTLSLNVLGLEIRKTRGERGLREIAKEIGISAATLSRVEAGRQPDLDTFTRICKWLKLNPSEVLGFDENQVSSVAPLGAYTNAHFRASRELKPETAKHLANLILSMEKYLSELSLA